MESESRRFSLVKSLSCESMDPLHEGALYSIATAAVDMR